MTVIFPGYARASVAWQRVARRAAVVLLSALPLVACTDGADVSEPNLRGNTTLPIAAYYAGGPAYSSMAINRIRVTVQVDPDGQRFGPFTFDVDPSQTEWNLPVEFPLNEAVSVVVLAELISFANGTETVEYSGRIGPFRVTPGPQTQAPPPVPVFRGPLENLSITALQVSPGGTVIEGGSVRLQATVVGGGPNPQVFWASLDPTLATVDNTGLVTTLLPGTARIIATAGPRTDEAQIVINRRMSRIEITPGSRSATSLGETLDFTARVLDPRNAEFTGITINWAVANSAIAEQVSPGRFRTKARGRTTVTASVPNSTLSATGELVVDQRVARIEVRPGAAALEAIGANVTFTAAGLDNNGNTIPGLVFRWTSSNAAVASIDQNGVATARSTGRVDIAAEVDALSNQAALDVRQKVASVEVSPREFEFSALQEKTRFTAVARDANGNLVPNKTFVWRTLTSTVVSVDQDGTATAAGRGATSVTAEVDGVIGVGVAKTTQLPKKITFNVANVILPSIGATFTLQAIVRDANGFPLQNAPVQYYSQSPSVVTVTPAGVVTAVGTGIGRIAAASNGFTQVIMADVQGGTRLGGDKLLFLHQDGEDVALHLKEQIVNTGRYLAPNVQFRAMSNTLPTFDELLQYHTIIVWSNYQPINPVAHGDLLKRYVDAGGRVILAVYAYTNVPGGSWQMRGGIMDHGYSPFMNNNQSIDGIRTLDVAGSNMAHPIMQGITGLTYGVNSNYTRALMDEGATLVAKDTNGVPIVGVNSTGLVIGINIWPGFQYHGPEATQIYRVFANAARY